MNNNTKKKEEEEETCPIGVRGGGQLCRGKGREQVRSPVGGRLRRIDNKYVYKGKHIHMYV